MKRKLVWLTLPIMLCALVWGVKWRADHPTTPTELDLKARALMLESSSIEIGHDLSTPLKLRANRISKAEMKPFIDSLFLIAQPPSISPVMGPNGAIRIDCTKFYREKKAVLGVLTTISVDNGRTKVMVGDMNSSYQYQLHPYTAKRWMELLLNHPRIGPELRARLQH